MSEENRAERLDFEDSISSEAEDLIRMGKFTGEDAIFHVKKKFEEYGLNALKLLKYVDTDYFTSEEIVRIIKIFNLPVFNLLLGTFDPDAVSEKENEIKSLKARITVLQNELLRKEEYSKAIVSIHELTKLKSTEFDNRLKDFYRDKEALESRIDSMNYNYNLSNLAMATNDLDKMLKELNDIVPKASLQKEYMDKYYQIRSYFCLYQSHLQIVRDYIAEYNKLTNDICEFEKRIKDINLSQKDMKEFLKIARDEINLYLATNEKITEKQENIDIHEAKDFIESAKKETTEQLAALLKCNVTSVLVVEKLSEIKATCVPETLMFEIIGTPALQQSVVRDLKPESISKVNGSIIYNKTFMYVENNCTAQISNSFNIMSKNYHDGVNGIFYVFDYSVQESFDVCESLVEFFKEKQPFAECAIYGMNKKNAVVKMDNVTLLSSKYHLVQLDFPSAQEAFVRFAKSIIDSYSDEILKRADPFSNE